MRLLLLMGLGWLVSLSAVAQTTTELTNTPPTQVENAMGMTVTLPNYGAGTLDSVYNSFINAIGGINLSGYISGLFWTLAGIALIWQLFQLILSRGEIGDVFAGLIRWLLFTSIAWVFVAPGGYVFQMMSVSMFGDVSQSMGEVTPSGIVDIGINILSTAYGAVKWNSPTTWANFGVAFAVFMMMLSVALEFLVMMIAANVYINVGVVTLGFAGSNWTKDFAFGYFKGIFIAALQILGLVVVVRIAQAMFVEISSSLIYPNDVEPSPGMMWDACLQAFIVGLAMKLLSNRVPTMLAGILSGNFAYSPGNALGSAVTMAAGAGALAGGLATLGASGLANRFTGAAVKGLGSTLNGLAQGGSAMSTSLQAGNSLSSILSAGRSGFSSGFSEFSKAAGQTKDAPAAGGAGTIGVGSSPASRAPGAGISQNNGYPASGVRSGSGGTATKNGAAEGSSFQMSPSQSQNGYPASGVRSGSGGIANKSGTTQRLSSQTLSSEPISDGRAALQGVQKIVAGTAAAVGIDGVPNNGSQSGTVEDMDESSDGSTIPSNSLGIASAQTTVTNTPEMVTATPSSMTAKAVQAAGKGLYKAGEAMAQHRSWKGVAYGLGAIAGNALSVRNFTGFG